MAAHSGTSTSSGGNGAPASGDAPGPSGRRDEARGLTHERQLATLQGLVQAQATTIAALQVRGRRDGGGGMCVCACVHVCRGPCKHILQWRLLPAGRRHNTPALAHAAPPCLQADLGTLRAQQQQQVLDIQRQLQALQQQQQQQQAAVGAGLPPGQLRSVSPPSSVDREGALATYPSFGVEDFRVRGTAQAWGAAALGRDQRGPRQQRTLVPGGGGDVVLRHATCPAALVQLTRRHDALLPTQQRLPDRFILVRHAESVGNLDAERYAGERRAVRRRGRRLFARGRQSSHRCVCLLGHADAAPSLRYMPPPPQRAPIRVPPPPETPDYDIPLSAQGHMQAEACGQTIRRMLDATYGASTPYKLHFVTSPYTRSRQTYVGVRSAFTESQVAAVHESVQLREQDFGNFQVPLGPLGAGGGG